MPASNPKPERRLLNRSPPELPVPVAVVGAPSVAEASRSAAAQDQAPRGRLVPPVNLRTMSRYLPVDASATSALAFNPCRIHEAARFSRNREIAARAVAIGGIDILRRVLEAFTVASTPGTPLWF